MSSTVKKKFKKKKPTITKIQSICFKIDGQGFKNSRGS